MCPCPHYYESIDSILHLVADKEGDPESFDYEAESKSDRLARWDLIFCSTFCDENSTNDEISFEDHSHYNVFHLF